MTKNYFITFEGIDGSGKDTQLNELVKYIKEDNKLFGDKYTNIWITRNPTKITKYGIEVSRRIKEEDIDGKTATKLYIKDRIEHSKIIKEILKHSFVLSSRFDISTLTYQHAQGENFEELYNLHKYSENDGVLIPDLTIIFDIDPEISFERVNKRNEKLECFEKLEFQKKLIKSQEYCINELKKRGRNIIIVNANQSIKEITLEMIQKIEEFLSKK